MQKNKLYHGTTTILNVQKYIVPSKQSGVLREEFRKTNLNKVWLTDSLPSAEKYASKAVGKYGGSMLVLECTPIGEYYQSHNHEVICEAAKVIREVE